MMWRVDFKWHIRLSYDGSIFTISKMDKVKAVTVEEVIQKITIMGRNTTRLYSDIKIQPIGQLKVENEA